MSDPERYVLECHTSSSSGERQVVSTRHETTKSAVAAAANALLSLHIPFEVRIVDTHKLISEQEAYDAYVASCHTPDVWASHFTFLEWRAMGRPRGIHRSDGNWPTPWPTEGAKP